MQHRVFVTGGTGYVGSRLIPLLVSRGDQVTAVVRQPSRGKINASCNVVIGDALDGRTYQDLIGSSDTFVHLVGVPHPSPAKAREFVAIDFKAAEEAIRVAARAGINHFVYVSVAQPAPVMKAYIAVRGKCEEMLRASGLNATIVRPWYVLGPGHRWPEILKPVYGIAEWLPSTRHGARRLGLVTINQMIRTLAAVVHNPAEGTRILEVPDIRRIGAAYPDSAEICLQT